MFIIVVQDLLTFTEADIKDLGVKNSAHRARVVSSLVALRMKHEKGKWHRSFPEDIHYCALHVCFFECGIVGGAQKPVSAKDDSPNLQISYEVVLNNRRVQPLTRIQHDIQCVPFIMPPSEEGLHLPGLLG